MKKMLALILTLTLLASALAACSSTKSGDDEPSKEPVEESGSDDKEPAEGSEEDPGAEDKGETNEPPEENGDDLPEENGEDPIEEEPPEEPVEKPEIDGGEIAETVLLDEMDVKITATKLETSDSRAELTLLLENNTDKNLKFLSGTLGYSANSVNGWMIEDGFLNTTIAPGKKSYETVYIDDDNLAMLGLTDIADISLAMEIEDDNYNTYLTTGPMELKTSLADSYDYAADTFRKAIEGDFPRAYDMELLTVDDTPALDKGGFRSLSQALLKNSAGEYILLTEVENTSDADMDIYSQGFAVNGVLVEGSRWSTSTVLAGKRAVVVSNLSSMIDKNIWGLFGFDEVGRIDYMLGLEYTDGDEFADAEGLSLTVPGAPQEADTSGTELYNGNGIRIVSKGFTEDDFDLSSDLHLALLVENGASADIIVDEEYDSLSINGFMSSCTLYSTAIPSGATGIVDVELSEYSLEDINITSIEDIEELEITLSIQDTHYNDIDSPTIKVEKQA